MKSLLSSIHPASSATTSLLKLSLQGHLCLPVAALGAVLILTPHWPSLAALGLGSVSASLKCFPLGVRTMQAPDFPLPLRWLYADSSLSLPLPDNCQIRVCLWGPCRLTSLPTLTFTGNKLFYSYGFHYHLEKGWFQHTYC